MDRVLARSIVACAFLVGAGAWAGQDDPFDQQANDAANSVHQAAKLAPAAPAVEGGYNPAATAGFGNLADLWRAALAPHAASPSQDLSRPCHYATVSGKAYYVCEDVSMVLDGDRLYPVFSGAGGKSESMEDFASQVRVDPWQYLTLDAQQQDLFRQDPQLFLRDINFDFSSPAELKQDFSLQAKGDDRVYQRTEVGAEASLDQRRDASGNEYPGTLQASKDRFTYDTLREIEAIYRDNLEEGKAAIPILDKMIATIAPKDGKPTAEIQKALEAERDRIQGDLPGLEAQYKNAHGDRIAFGKDKGFLDENGNELSATQKKSRDIENLQQSILKVMREKQDQR